MFKTGIKIAAALLLLWGLPTACTKYNLIHTGLSNGKHDKPMQAYFAGDAYNWSLTQELIAQAKLEHLFTPTSGEGITFLGITNHSIRRYVLQRQDEENAQAEEEGRSPRKLSIKDIPQEDAEEMIKRCIIKGRHKLEDIPLGKFSENPDEVIGTGGREYETLAGTKLWLCTFREPYERIPDAGPISIYVVSAEKQKRVKIASSNIETLTGIVHSLPYREYTLGDL